MGWNAANLKIHCISQADKDEFFFTKEARKWEFRMCALSSATVFYSASLPTVALHCWVLVSLAIDANRNAYHDAVYQRNLGENDAFYKQLQAFQEGLSKDSAVIVIGNLNSKVTSDKDMVFATVTIMVCDL